MFLVTGHSDEGIPADHLKTNKITVYNDTHNKTITTTSGIFEFSFQQDDTWHIL
jgi:hypothetical protein